MASCFAGIYAILDTQIIRGRDPGLLAAAAARGGATTMQLRAKDLSTRAFIDLARRVHAGLAGTSCPLLINDRIDVALAIGAEGVHVGRDDMEPAAARHLLGPGKIIGVTLKNTDDLAVLGPDVDYGCIGGVYPTRHKANPDAPVGLDGFAVLRRAAASRAPAMPIGAIAGITPDNAGVLKTAGADFIAVVGAVFAADDVEAATRRLAAAFASGGAVMTPRAALTIAGSDSGGGAGIQADLKTFAAFGVFGTSAITALTAQNTVGVQGIHGIPAAFVTAQIASVCDDIDVRAIKIGMLAEVEIIAAVATALDVRRAIPVVLDPVMIATSGDRLIALDAVAALVRALLPRAHCVTPNLHEAALLSGMPVARTEDEMAAQGRAILAQGAATVLVKGGHGASDESVDLLVAPSGVIRFAAPRIDSANTHGTGCSLSAAIAAGLALGHDLETSVRVAKIWLTGAIAAARHEHIGHGHGPVHHFHDVVLPARYA
jgi:hydroxymethylpyrimidine kinase/phosphomethylpyrimidine kinase/thiamine-phosphate diphosphorylase